MDPTARVSIGGCVNVTRLGVGGANLGQPSERLPDDQAVAVVRTALASGLNLIDTAPRYGAGRADERIAEALRDYRRDQYLLCSKVGYAAGETNTEALGPPRFDFSYDGVTRSIEGTLERLKVDKLDLVLLHDPDEHFHEAIANGYRALKKLQSEGVISCVGVGMNQVEMLVQFLDAAPFDCILLAGRYTLLDQSALLNLLPACSDRSIGVIAGGPFNSGILADVGNVEATFDYRPPLESIRDKAQRIAEVAKRHSVSVRAAALQFVAAHPAVACTIPGTRSVDHVRDNIQAMREHIPGEFWMDLRREKLISEEAPLPS